MRVPVLEHEAGNDPEEAAAIIITLVARNTKLLTVFGAAMASSEASKVPVVILKVAVYFLHVSIVIGGGAVYSGWRRPSGSG